jgi:hypothetical protein
LGVGEATASNPRTFASAFGSTLVSSTPTMQIGLNAAGGCNGLAGIASFGAWLGRPATHVTEGWTYTSWSALMTDVTYDLNCYKPLQNTVNFTFGLPMVPADGTSTLASGAAGAYDVYFITIAKNLVAKGYSNATLRVGWEFNGSWFPWASYKDPKNFITYFQRIVTLMRSVPGQHFKFDWCPSIGANALAPDYSYPGDAYVDYVGMDVYDAVWNSTMNAPAARWTQFVNQPDGLQWQVNFAAAHHKQLSLPEWGVGGKNSGDDPYFINAIAQWTKSHGYAYIDYWDLNSGGYNGQLSHGQFPLSARAFVTDFH